MRNHKYQILPTGTPAGAKFKQISPTGVSGETITQISNSKRDNTDHSLFGLLDIIPQGRLRWDFAPSGVPDGKFV